jgi:hypothetical protein
MMMVSFSGGADSSALAWYLKDRGEEVELVMADTGAELPETYFFAPQVARRLGVTLQVKSSATFFQRLVGWGFMLPSFKVRWCTRELKTDALPSGMAVGICADEAHRMPEMNRPLVDAGITKADARVICVKHDLLNPCYKWRTSCSCFCCPFQRKRDWLGLMQQHPDLYALAEAWESESIQNSQTKFTWSGSFELAELRKATKEQIKLWEEPRGEACAICQW